MINKIKKYLQIDFGYYLKNTGYLFANRVLNILCALILSIVFARFLSKEVYGQYNFILAVLGMVSVFSLTGMNAAVTQAVANGYDGILIKALKKKLKWSLLGIVVLLGISAYYFSIDSYLMAKAFVVSAVFFPFFYNFRIFSDFLLGKKKFFKMTKYHISASILILIIMLTTIYFVNDLVLLVLAFLASNSLIWAFFFKLSLKELKNNNEDEESISFGKKISLINVIRTITNQLDRVIVGLLLGFTELAIYSIASAIPQNIAGSTNSISSVAFPKLSVKNKDEAYLAVKKKVLHLIVIGIFISIVMVLILPYLIPFLYSDQYQESVFYAQLLSLSLIFVIPTQIISKALFPAQKEIKKIAKFKINSSIIELGLLFILGFTMGLFGVVLARLIGRMIAMFYSFKLAFLSKKI